MAKAPAKKAPQIIYSPPQGVVSAFTNETLDYTIPCPICDKRTIDVSELPDRLIKLRYKCPHCRNIVTTPLVAAGEDSVPILQMSKVTTTE